MQPDNSHQQDTLCGRLAHIEYWDDETAFSIIQLATETNTFRAVGTLVDPCLHTILSLDGQWESDHNGQLFSFHDYLSKPPAKKEHLIHYIELRTGLARGHCQSLVEFAGVNILNIIDTDPGKLLESGVPKTSVQRLVDVFSQRSGYERIRQELNIAGIPIAKLSALHRIIGEQVDLTAALQVNPFLLYLWFTDTSFFDVQKIARYRNIPLGADIELQAACLAALRFAQNKQGDTAQTYKQLSTIVSSLLSLPEPADEMLIKKNTQLIPRAIVTSFDTFAALRDNAVHEFGIINSLSSRIDGVMTPSLFKTEKTVIGEITHTHGHTLDILHTLSCLRTVVVLANDIESENTLLINLSTLFSAHHADALFITAYPQQADVLSPLLPHNGAILAEDIYGVTPSGTPIHTSESPVEGEVFIIARISSYPIHILHYLLKSIPAQATLIMTGSNNSPLSPLSGDIRQTLQKIENLTHLNVDDKTLATFPSLGEEGITRARVNWMTCGWNNLLSELHNIIESLAKTMPIDPIKDVLIVLPKNTLSTGEKINETIQTLLRNSFFGEKNPLKWNEKTYVVGEPVLTTKATIDPPSPAYTRATIDSINEKGELSLTTSSGRLTMANTIDARLLPGFSCCFSRLIAGSTKVIICCVHPEHTNEITAQSLKLMNDTATIKTFLLGAIVENIPKGVVATRVTSFNPEHSENL
jgi:hypothetical protein